MTGSGEFLTFSLIARYNPGVLEYLSQGERDYSADPLPIYIRREWEFQAVIRGSCAPTFPRLRENYSEKRLWLFSPNNAHGWTGEPGRRCEIVVFHFDRIPHVMKTLVPRNGFASVRLTGRDIATIKRHYRRCRECLHSSNVKSELVRQSALLDLCLILVERLKISDTFVQPSKQVNMMISSLAWYEEQMSKGSSLDEVAKHIGISTSHMRRIYQSVLHLSPQQEFLRRRMSRAKYLLEITSMSVSEIASATGYKSVSSFSRAFTQACGVSPKDWRKNSSQRPEG